MESIVRVPKNEKTDYDFIAFSFNGKHSYEDFSIYRINDGNRYVENLSQQLKDLTAQASGDGTYYFGSYHKEKIFNINFAFDNLTDVKIRELKIWLGGKETADLWFAEAPYKVYTAKVTGQPRLNFIPFDKIIDGKSMRVYKGEGTVQFTCYFPYAHTPDKIQRWNGSEWIEIGSGLTHTSYMYFQNYETIKTELPGYSSKQISFGDVPFCFVAKLQAPESEIDVKIATMAIDNEIGTTYDITIPQSVSIEKQEYIIGG